MTESNQGSESPHTPDTEGGSLGGELETLLRKSTPGFDTGFADRVMGRIESEASRESAIAVALQQQFRRWAPLALAASLALAAFNVSQAGNSEGQTMLEAMLGLEPVSLVSAYTIAVPGSFDSGDGS